MADGKESTTGPAEQPGTAARHRIANTTRPIARFMPAGPAVLPAKSMLTQ
jgi:hypothetical protein